MASRSVKTLGIFQKPTIFDEGIGRLLPEAYKEFYKEWKLTQPTAVHYVPQKGNWKRDEVTGEVMPVQNVPIPLIYPKEHNDHIWGGEGIVQGFQKRDKHNRRVPHFWVPQLKRSVVYSEILNKHISVVLTNRAVDLINSEFGFDHYILKTPACDLKSLLALRIKRHLLKELSDGCPAYKSHSQKQEEVYGKYKQYLTAFTPEKIEWYGYSFSEACRKFEDQMEEQQKPIPMKIQFRSALIDKLKAAGIKEASEDLKLSEPSSWLQKINIFNKKHVS